MLPGEVIESAPVLEPEPKAPGAKSALAARIPSANDGTAQDLLDKGINGCALTPYRSWTAAASLPLRLVHQV
jgi:hypothetical protein